MDFVWVNPGGYVMGAPESFFSNPHPVLISRGFWMQKAPVSYLQFAQFKGGRSNSNSPYPIHWWGAQDYISWIQQLHPGADWKYSMPSEAQFEYACRAGSQTSHWWGRWSKNYNNQIKLNPIGLFFIGIERADVEHDMYLKDYYMYEFKYGRPENNYYMSDNIEYCHDLYSNDCYYANKLGSLSRNKEKSGPSEKSCAPWWIGCVDDQALKAQVDPVGDGPKGPRVVRYWRCDFRAARKADREMAAFRLCVTR